MFEGSFLIHRFAYNKSRLRLRLADSLVYRCIRYLSFLNCCYSVLCTEFVEMTEQKNANVPPTPLLSDRILEILTPPLGLDVMRKNFRFTYNTIFFIFQLALHFINSAYTCCKNENDLFKIMEVMCINALAIPVSHHIQIHQ